MRLPERLIPALAVCLLAVAVPAVALGTREGIRTLKDARELLAQKHYSEALKLAQHLRSEHPDLREEADAIIKTVFGIRNLFNTMYDRLREALESGDTERGRALVEQLKSLDPYPEPLAQRAIAEAERALRFADDYASFASVMERGATLLAQGQPAMAMQAYLGGLEIGRREFDAAGYGDVTVNETLSAMAELRGRGTEVADAGALIAAADANLDRLLAGSLDSSARAGFEASTMQLVNSLSSGAEALADSAEALKKTNESIAAVRSDHQDDLWLHLVVRIALGREGKTEGMAYAAQQQWLGAVIGYAEKTARAARTSFAAAVERVDAGDARQVAEAALAEARERGLLAVSAAVTLGRAHPPLEAGSEQARRFASAMDLVPEFQEQVDETDGYGELVRLRERMAGLPDAAASSLDAARAGRASAAEQRAAAVDLSSQWQRKAAAWDARQAEGATIARQAQSASQMAARFTEEAATLLARDTAFAVRIATLETAGFQPAYDAAASLRDRGRLLAEGQPAEAGGAAGIRQPGQALTTYLQADEGLATLAGELAGYTERWKAEKPNVSASGEVTSLLASVAGLQSRVDALRAELAGLADQMRSVLGQARSLRADGDRSYDKAIADKGAADAVFDPEKETVAPEAYDAIVTLLDGAAGSYERALAIEEHAVTRERLAGIPDIRADALSRAYRLRVAVVNRQIQQAGELYEKGDLTGARALLDAAAAALALMGEKQPNPLLEYYQKLISISLGLGTQEIEQTDPLYPDISNLMFQASEAYAEAKRLVARGSSRTDSMVTGLLVRAQDKLDVVKAILPRYLKADLLRLYVRELSLGEAAYSAAIDAEVKRYLDDLARGDVTRKQSAYEQLDVIYQSAPKTYASLKKPLDSYKASVLSQAQAIDPASKAESQRLLADALGKYRRNDPNTWDEALYLLYQAQRADPRNLQVQNLVLTIRMDRGPKGDLLVDTDPAHRPFTLYTRAYQAYVSNQFATAKAYMDQLYGESPGFSNTDVDQLYARIRGKLGI